MVNDPMEQRLKQALRTSDGESAQIESVRDMLLESFRMRSRFLLVGGLAKTIGFFAIGIWAVFRFFEAESTRAIVGWGLLALWCTLGATLIWMFYWMILNRNATARELKRLELQLAALDQRLETR